MTVEAVPVGQVCNLKCTYCYENTMREAGNLGGSYDLDAMIKTLREEGQQFTVFGGEPLLMKFPDLERLLQFGFETYKGNGIQTNGALIEDRHVELFKRTNTYVGVSIDGPGELNAARPPKENTEKTLRNIEIMVKSGVGVGLIVTLNYHNAAGGRLEYLKSWFRELDKLGIKSARLHLLEGHHARDIELSKEDTLKAFLELYRFEMRELKNLRFDKFDEMLSLLSNDGKNVSCVWNDCDPYTTNAVRGVNGDGSRSNCGRANKEGVDWVKANSSSHIRQLALYHTPQSDGGCGDCRFFLVCRGYCPGTAIDQDWRNRTEHCETLKDIYGVLEEALLNVHKTPISLSPDRKQLEMDLLAKLGNNSVVRNQVHIDWHMNNGVFTGTVPVK
jgi:uncharacterized protein